MPGDPLELETGSGFKAAIVVGFVDDNAHVVYTRLVDATEARQLIELHTSNRPLSWLRGPLLDLPQVLPERANLGSNRLANSAPYDLGTLEDRTAPAPGYTVRWHATLGWIYAGKRDGRSNGGHFREDAIAETWTWHDFDATMRGEAAQLCSDIGKAVAAFSPSTQRTPVAWVDPKCPTCMGTRVLRHADPSRIEESCPDCPPEVKPGPSEWTLTESVLNRHDEDCEAWHYTFARADKTVLFRVVSHAATKFDPAKTVASRFTHHDPQLGNQLFGESIPSVTVMGERCPEMVRDRLLAGLRDNSVSAWPRHSAHEHLQQHRIHARLVGAFGS
jgi:hypothetical protein